MIVCPGKVVSVDLLTDRNYVSKSAVIIVFSLFVTYGVSGIVYSRKVVYNRY